MEKSEVRSFQEVTTCHLVNLVLLLLVKELSISIFEFLIIIFES